VSHSGTAVLVKAGPNFEVLARNELQEPVLATPAIAEGRLLIRTASHLYSFGSTNKIEITFLE
jgi:hypothetical protein